jgi:hypothetical protein
MKSIIPAVILAVLLATTSYLSAQDSKFGLRTGVNLVSFSGDDAKLFNDQDLGFFVGFYYDYIYTDRIGVEAGFLYSRSKSSEGPDSSSVTLGYIDVPLLFKYYINQNINLCVGPQISLLGEATSDGDGNAGFNEGTIGDASEFFKIGKAAMTFGAEYKTNFDLVLNLRYNLGLGSIVATDIEYFGITEVETEYDVKHNSLQIGIGYLF